MTINPMHVFARLARIRVPKAVSSVSELVEVAMSPSMPTWDYWPKTGPYRIVRVSVDDPDLLFFYSDYETINLAIEEFYYLNQPQVAQSCMLIDGRDVCVVGWTHHGDDEADVGWEWFGCEFAFHVLAAYNLVDAALWEELARQKMRNFQ